ncbi:histone protein [Streptomyces sp. NBC_01014]|uniref:histone protein n=1 Tax=Streptomyces sp. NBC_01014 TaxID=2903719 RepID=UPI00386D52CE|nr:histone protein [Streptomyces sp. NBC_01014]
MENSTKVSLAAAVAAGYVLGRTKKGKLAIGLASLVAGQQLPLNPRELVSMGARKLAANPQVAPLIEQARGDVLDAGRTALSATANRRLEAVADALQERTNALLEPPPDEDEDHDEEEDEDEPEDEEPEEEEEEEEEEEPPRRRPTKRSAGAAKKTPSKKAPAKKAPAKKTAAKKTAPKRTAAKKPAKKTAEKKPSTKGAAAKESSNRNSRRR